MNDFSVTVTYIEKAMPTDSKSLFSQRGNVDHIIMFDWISSVKHLEVGSTLKTLKDALYKVEISILHASSLTVESK